MSQGPSSNSSSKSNIPTESTRRDKQESKKHVAKLDDPKSLESLLTADISQRRVLLVWSMLSSFHLKKSTFLAHAVSLEAFLKAQFYNAQVLEHFHVTFLSLDGKYAAVMRDNQAKYHPSQQSSGYSISDLAVVDALQGLERTWSKTDEKNLALFHMMASAYTQLTNTRVCNAIGKDLLFATVDPSKPSKSPTAHGSRI